MSNPDSFIDEVTEEVRRERLFRVMRRYGWIAVVGVVALVAGAAWYEWQAHQERVASEAFGDSVMAAMDAPDAPARAEALAGIGAAGDQAAVLRLLAAGEALAGPAGAARDKALADLAAVAGDGSVSPVWRDLALLRRLAAPGTDVPAAERAAGLAALAEPGRPFRPLAQEQIALDKLAAGDKAGALADFRAVAADTQAPSALRARAGQMIVVLGGGAEAPARNQAGSRP